MIRFGCLAAISSFKIHLINPREIEISFLSNYVPLFNQKRFETERAVRSWDDTYRSRDARSLGPSRHVSQLFLGKRRGTRIIVSSYTAVRQ